MLIPWMVIWWKCFACKMVKLTFQLIGDLNFYVNKAHHMDRVHFQFTNNTKTKGKECLYLGFAIVLFFWWNIFCIHNG